MTHLQRVQRGLTRRLRAAATALAVPLEGSTVSVIIVASGEARFLDDCVSSVLASSHRNLDVILVADRADGGACVAIRDRTITDKRVRALASSPDRSSLEHAIDQAGGDYVAFVDGDDLVPPDAYAQLLAVLKESGSDFVVGQQFRRESGSYREIPWSAALDRGRRLRAKVIDIPSAMADSGHGNRLFSLDFWRRAGLHFGDAGLGGAPVVMTEAFLRCASFDILPERVYDECVRDGSRPLAEQRRYQSSDLRARLVALRSSATLVDENLGKDVLATWLGTVLDRVFPPLYRDTVVADEKYVGVLSEYSRELLRSGPPGVLESVPVQARIGVWLAMNARSSDSTALALMAEYAADNSHGLPTRPATGSDGVQVVIPDSIGTEVPDRVRRVQPVDLKPRSRLTRVAITDCSVVIDGAAFFEYGSDTVTAHLEMVNSETGTRRSLRTEARPDPGVNRWAARAWEDHSEAGFTAKVAVGDLVEHTRSEPSGWVVEVRLSGNGVDVTVPFQTRDAQLIEGVQHTVAGRQVCVRWDNAVGFKLALDPAGSSTSKLRPPSADVAAALVDTVTITPDGLRISGQTTLSGLTRWRVTGARGAGELSESVAEGGRFTAILDLTHTAWGQEGTPLPVGRYRIEVSDTDGSDVLLRWGDGASTGGSEDLMTERLRVEVHPRNVGGADVMLFPPVPAHARGVYAQNRLRTVAYPSARERALADTVLFESFGGRSVGDNPGAICAEILRRDIGIDVAWVVDDPSLVVPQGTRAVARRSPEWYELMATARGYVGNAGAPYFFRKRNDQFHLQTWHGTPLKRIGEDRPPDGFEIWRHNRQIRAQAANWDALVSPSPYCSDIFRSAFRYDGTLLESGYPRNDVLFSDDRVTHRARVRAALGLGEGERVVLYAPTSRENAGAKEPKPLYLDADLLSRKLTDTVVLVRGHYNRSSDVDAAYPDTARTLDVTRYPDIADLFLAADVLVTDYSSVMFDFALTDKPMILLVPDLEQYRDVERGFYFDIEAKAPGPMVRSTQEVVEVLDGPDRFADSRDHFRRTFCPFDDGRASGRVVDNLLHRW